MPTLFCGAISFSQKKILSDCVLVDYNSFTYGAVFWMEVAEKASWDLLNKQINDIWLKKDKEMQANLFIMVFADRMYSKYRIFWEVGGGEFFW